MKFTCRTCSCVFNKKLTLREKNNRYKPQFCGEDCAIAWKIAENKKNKKSRKIGNRGSSKEEIIFGKTIKSFFPSLVPQYQIKDYDHYYDFYCPELNLLLEYNGSYWHNKRFMRIKDSYHINAATKRGIYIAMISDVDWKKFIENSITLDKNSVVKFLNEHIKNMEE